MFHPGKLTGTPITTREELEAAIRSDYERLHPGDSFDAFKRRAVFDKNEKGLLQSWMALAAQRRAGGPSV